MSRGVRLWPCLWFGYSSIGNSIGNPNRGPLERAIIILAIPMVLEMVMESVFAVVNIFSCPVSATRPWPAWLSPSRWASVSG